MRQGPRRRRASRIRAAVRNRQHRLETRLERRYPALYDARHAAKASVHALWPLISPLLAGLVLLPIFAIVGLFTLLDLQVPALPSVDLPNVDVPSVAVPSWLRAVADAIGAFFSFLGAIAKYVLIAGVIALGVMRTRDVRRRRINAERLGRTELLRRLEIALVNIETRAREKTAERVGDAARSKVAA